MARYAVVNKTGETVNVIIWDGVQQYDPGEGLSVVPEKDAPEFVPPQSDAPVDAIKQEVTDTLVELGVITADQAVTISTQKA